MSFDLAVWNSERAIDAQVASDIYAALSEGVGLPDDSGVLPSPAVAAFIAALDKQYPNLDTLNDADLDSSPWASGFESSDSHVLLNIRWKASNEVIASIVELAAEHGLVLYDPQGDEVHLPPRLRSARKNWQFWRR